MKKSKTYFCKSLFVCLIFLQFSACQYFEKKVPTENELLKKELKSINWDKVDEYPSVNSCDSILDIETRKKCFFNFISTQVLENLKAEKFHIMYPRIDTLFLKVTVSANADLYFETQNLKDSILDKVKIDSVINAKLINFPRVIPAVKRGIPVKSQFDLPVALK